MHDHLKRENHQNGFNSAAGIHWAVVNAFPYDKNRSGENHLFIHFSFDLAHVADLASTTPHRKQSPGEKHRSGRTMLRHLHPLWDENLSRKEGAMPQFVKATPQLRISINYL